MKYTFESIKANLSIDFTQARLDLAAMALTHIETSGLMPHLKLDFYTDKLEYSLTSACLAIEENKKAYLYMKNQSFKTSELLAMARSV